MSAVVRRPAAVLALVVVVLMLWPGQGRACSCAGQPAVEALEHADGAIVGRPVAVTGPFVNGPNSSSLDPVFYEFAVDAVAKGDVAERIVVSSAADGASCGLEVAMGEEVGLLLYREAGAWTANLCGTYGGDDIRAIGDLRAPIPGSEVPEPEAGPDDGSPGVPAWVPIGAAVLGSAVLFGGVASWSRRHPRG